MEEKNKGREFLFSKYFGFIDNEDEDGIIRRDSDGSIYYYGSEGRGGRIQPDKTLADELVDIGFT